ncbi:MAG: glycosyltransferase family 4 protein [Chitinophagales bacterium]|nr:glycosyltransferase family 4 protein [Chitinophagales bacterium]
MRIGVISTMNGFSWGGSEELWYETVSAAIGEGHTVKVILFRNEPKHEKISHLEEKGVEVFFMESSSGYKRRYLVQRIKNKIFPVTTEPGKWFSFVDELKLDVLLLSQGGAADICYYRDLSAFVLNKSIPLNIINHHLAERVILSKEQKEILINIIARAKKNFFVSYRNAEVLQRTLASSFDYEVVKNPVKIKLDQAIDWPQNEIPSIGVVARLDVSFKGQDVLLQLISQKKWQERKFKLNFYGSGPDKDYLQDLIHFYKVKDKVSLYGQINDIEDVWRNNHLLLLPSLSEGTPLSVVEAMVCGRSCVVTDVGDCARIVEDEKTGWVAACASVNALDETLERAWNDRAKWKDMGLAAREAILKEIDYNAGETFLKELLKD